MKSGREYSHLKSSPTLLNVALNIELIKVCEQEELNWIKSNAHSEMGNMSYLLAPKVLLAGAQYHLMT